MVREVTLHREAAEVRPMYLLAWELVASSHASPKSPFCPLPGGQQEIPDFLVLGGGNPE